MKKITKICIYILLFLLTVFILLTLKKYIYITEFINRVNSYSNMNNYTIEITEDQNYNNTIVIHKLDSSYVYKINNIVAYKNATSESYYRTDTKIEKSETSSKVDLNLLQNPIELPTANLNIFWNRIKFALSFDTQLMSHTYNNIDCKKLTFLNYDKSGLPTKYTVYLNSKTFDPVYVETTTTNYEYTFTENNVTLEDVKLP